MEWVKKGMSTLIKYLVQIAAAKLFWHILKRNPVFTCKNLCVCMKPCVCMCVL